MLTPLKLDRYAREQGYELYCIGLPKTVDNDMHGTDHTPGYASAARWLAAHTRDSALDLYTMRGFDHFKLIEVMGRHAGWLAAATWLAQSENFAVPHLVLVPEIIFDEQFFLSEVERIFRQEGCVLAVASEGLRNAEGQFLAELSGTLQKDAIGKPILSIGEGVAGYLCRLVSQKLGIKARYDKPGTLQRGAACVSPVDYQEALALGKMGLQIALEGKSAVMPGLVRVSDKPFRCVIEPVALAEIAGTEKPLPAEFLTETGVNIEAFCRYAAPLIGQPLEVPFRFEN
jgi:6-phosphofructokinase 1